MCEETESLANEVGVIWWVFSGIGNFQLVVLAKTRQLNPFASAVPQETHCTETSSFFEFCQFTPQPRVTYLFQQVAFFIKLPGKYQLDRYNEALYLPTLPIFRKCGRISMVPSYLQFDNLVNLDRSVRMRNLEALVKLLWACQSTLVRSFARGSIPKPLPPEVARVEQDLGA